MARIIIVDDDYQSELLVEQLTYRGHDVSRLRSVDEALDTIESLVKANLIILDVIMPQPTKAPDSISGGRNAGMHVYREIRRKNESIPILVYSGTSDVDIVELLNRDSCTRFYSKRSAHSSADFVSIVEALLGIKGEKRIPRPFIVHGHDNATKLAVKNYLQNTLNLPEPIILHEQPSLGRTVIEKFEHFAWSSQLAFVILTPDDQVAGSDASDAEKRRARQNVILELGFFLGTLGRSSGRVFLLYKGPLELPSDLGGVIYIDIGNGIAAAGELIRKELEHVLR